MWEHYTVCQRLIVHLIGLRVASRHWLEWRETNDGNRKNLCQKEEFYGNIFFCNFKFHLSFNTGTLLSYLFVPAINYNLKKMKQQIINCKQAEYYRYSCQTYLSGSGVACALVIPCVVINAKSS